MTHGEPLEEDGLDAERFSRDEENPLPLIFNLILVKRLHLEEGLESYNSRLRRDSTVFITSDKLNFTERTFKRVFEDPLSRPNLLTGLIR
jgi:hypothetical protein